MHDRRLEHAGKNRSHSMILSSPRIFKSNADLRQNDFVAGLQKNALAVSLRYGNHRTVSYDSCSASAAVVEEAKAAGFGIILKVCVSPRNRRVFHRGVIFESNVIATHRAHIRVEDFHQSTDVDAMLREIVLAPFRVPEQNCQLNPEGIWTRLRSGRVAVSDVKA